MYMHNKLKHDRPGNAIMNENFNQNNYYNNGGGEGSCIPLQSLSVAVQRGNAISLMSSL